MQKEVLIPRVLLIKPSYSISSKPLEKAAPLCITPTTKQGDTVSWCDDILCALGHHPHHSWDLGIFSSFFRNKIFHPGSHVAVNIAVNPFLQATG